MAGIPSLRISFLIEFFSISSAVYMSFCTEISPFLIYYRFTFHFYGYSVNFGISCRVIGKASEGTVSSPL